MSASTLQKITGFEKAGEFLKSSHPEFVVSKQKLRQAEGSCIVRMKREEGQTMAEYGVVLAVIVLAVIAAITLLSQHVRDAITAVANVLPGG